MDKVQELENIKNKIEAFSKNHQIEILKILKKSNKVIINENKNGVFINLSFLPEDILGEIKYYLNYIHAQEDDLSMLETQKNEFKHIYFTEENHEN